MGDPAYTVFCALGAFLSLTTLPWHWQARSISTLIYLGWISTACMVAFTNSLLWAGNADNKAPVWCDIASRFTIALNTGITTAGLCIQRRLYGIATLKDVNFTPASRGREMIIDLVLGVGIPLFTVLLYHVIQGYRYGIIEDVGCWPGVYSTILSEPLHHIWPVLASSASFIYAVLTIRAFLKMRRQFSRVLSESDTNLNLSRFFRLMALAATEMSCSLPFSLYILVDDTIRKSKYQWASWGEIHEHIREVVIVTQEFQQANPETKFAYEITKWAIPACAFTFFVFFGMPGEATKQYKRVFWQLVALLSLKLSPADARNVTVDHAQEVASDSIASVSLEHTAVCIPSQSSLTRTENTIAPVAGSDEQLEHGMGGLAFGKVKAITDHGVPDLERGTGV